MYFGTKSYLKNIHSHTAKHARKKNITARPFIFQMEAETEQGQEACWNLKIDLRVRFSIAVKMTCRKPMIYHQRASWALEWKWSSLTVSIWRMDLRVWRQVKFEIYLFGQRLKSIRKPVLGTHSERAGVPRRGRKLRRSHSRAVELLVCFSFHTSVFVPFLN
jgi:hypothetical protein